MEWSIVSSVLLAIVITTTISILSRRRKSLGHGPKLPPGPPGWPIIGNLFDLGSMPHRSLADLRPKYGEVVWLKLGAINTMAVLSSRAAAELFRHHDLSFATRALTETSRAHDYHLSSVALAPYGAYWRVMRRLMTTEMFVGRRVGETAPLRRRCVDQMLTWIEEEKAEAAAVHVARFVFLMTFNLLGNVMLSRDLVDPNSEDGSEFFRAMNGLMEWSGHVNLADLFPWLSRVDPQGLMRKMERDMGKAIEIGSKFVRERMNEKKEESTNEKTKDLLDVLLEFEGSGKDEPSKLSERQMNIFILEVFFAGTETVSSSIEYAMTELLLNPDAMAKAKAKAELSQVVGSGLKLEEADIDKLPYLQAVVKESLRLHPPIPLLVPRKATNDTVFMGYFVPKNTQVFVNAWAIGRDPEVWNDASSFKPERFLDSNLDYRGQNYEYIPFGAGRRICAGLPLAQCLLHFVLGSLIHHFDWRLDEKVSRETMDMRDRMGIVARKLEPLFAVPTKGL
ncbi:Cytochrome P450, E-class, group I [Trema orientale]|uniref:Cytochrome P450, E-class, group I n=1 Tax=Trema orientale TaxID=63057 RepID=A0A2P5FVQ6_TREOI|nr:Cytochrome P450, E-class, group I [Trema orientale]